MQGLRPLTMTNNGQSASVVQYSAQSGNNGQQYYHMPGNKVMVQGRLNTGLITGWFSPVVGIYSVKLFRTVVCIS